MCYSYDYIAGIFDGEGFFVIRRSKPTNSKMGTRLYRSQAMAGVTIKEEYICKGLQDVFGGKVRFNPSKNIKHSDTYTWNITGSNLQTFCDVMVDYLLIKKDRAKLISEFQTLKTSIGNKPISDDNYELAESMYLQLRQLNKKGKLVSKESIQEAK